VVIIAVIVGFMLTPGGSTSGISYEPVKYTTQLEGKSIKCDNISLPQGTVTFNNDTVENRPSEPPKPATLCSYENEYLSLLKRDTPVYKVSPVEGGCLGPFWTTQNPENSNLTPQEWYNKYAIPYKVQGTIYVLEAQLSGSNSSFTVGYVSRSRSSSKNPELEKRPGGGTEITVFGFNQEQTARDAKIQDSEIRVDGEPIKVSDVAPGLTNCRPVAEWTREGFNQLPTPTTATTSSPTTAEKPGSTGGRLYKVSDSGCSTNPTFGSPEAIGTITNISDATLSFTINVGFDSSTGTVLDTGFANVMSLPAGQTARWLATGPVSPVPGISSCPVTSVETFP
jgi:hypothetical protein